MKTPDLRWPDGRPYDATEALAWEAGWEACAAIDASPPPSPIEEALDRAASVLAAMCDPGWTGPIDGIGEAFDAVMRAKAALAAPEEAPPPSRETVGALANQTEGDSAERTEDNAQYRAPGIPQDAAREGRQNGVLGSEPQAHSTRIDLGAGAPTTPPPPVEEARLATLDAAREEGRREGREEATDAMLALMDALDVDTGRVRTVLAVIRASNAPAESAGEGEK